MQAPYIYISYSKNDISFVRKLSDYLRSINIFTWIDIDNISPGESWGSSIERAINGAEALIYVASKHSDRSLFLEREMDLSLRSKRRIIPIVIDEQGWDNMPPLLMNFQGLDIARNGFNWSFNYLKNSLDEFRSSTTVKVTKPLSKGYVFLSYAEENSFFVDRLCKFLKEHDFAFWDYLQSEREYQSDYTIELENRIKNAIATISIISPEWKSSYIALQELHFSRDVGVPIFLVLLKDPGPTLAIAGMTYIDFRKNYEQGFLKLAAEMISKDL